MTDANLPPPAPPPHAPIATEEAALVAAKRGERDDRRRRRVELAGAVIIGIAAVLTAIAVYQGSGVDGTVQEKSTAAIGLTLHANDKYNEADAERAKERDWIFSWLTQIANAQPAADTLLAAMPVEVAALAGEWLEANEDQLSNPESELVDDPFSEVYPSYANLTSTDLYEEGNEIDEQATCALFESEVAGARSDSYGLATVFLAVALVVGGIAALLRGRAAQLIVLSTAIVSLLIGAGVLALATDETEAREQAAADFFPEDQNGTSLTEEQAVAEADEQCPETDE
jgi:hypothetical protein